MENNPTTKNVFDKLTAIESLLVATQPKPLTLKEAAEFLDFSRSYLYRLTSFLVTNLKASGFILTERSLWIGLNGIGSDRRKKLKKLRHLILSIT